MNKKTKKILIIEDQKDLVESLVILLKSQGYSAISAGEGIYGVNLAHKENVDLIILDLGLPAGDGLFVLENLKASFYTLHIPILILTAKQEKELEKKACKMGVVGYLYKPFDPEELLNCIKKIFNEE